MSSMVENLPVQRNQTLFWLVPLVADGLGLGFFMLVNRYLVARFGRNSIDMTALGTASLFVFIYIVFLVGLVLIRKQASTHTPYALLANRNLISVLAVLFALTFVMIVAHLTGYLSLIFDINFGDMGNSYYFLVTPAVYLVIGLLYLFILTQPISADKSTPSSAFLGLLLTNAFLATAASYLIAIKASFFVDWSVWGIGIVSYLILAAFFFLPRLIYFDKTRQRFSLLTFDILLFVFAVLIALA